MRQNHSPDDTPSSPPGNLPSWQAWIAEFGPRFLLFARNQTRSEEDAADVLQETLFELWQRNEGRPPDPPRVFSTLRRRAIDLARSTECRLAREQRWMGESFVQHNAWFDTGTDPDGHGVAEALRSIRPEFAEVVVLKIWGDLTFEQVAETLGIPASTAASRYRYGLEALRTRLKSPHTQLNPTALNAAEMS